MVKRKLIGMFEFFSEIGAVFKDSGIIFSATVAGSIALFIGNIFLARIFTPESFGVFKTVLNLALFMPALLDLGAGITLTKYIAEFSKKNVGKSKHLTDFFIRLRVVSFVVLIAILFVFREQIAGEFIGGSGSEVLLLAGLLTVAMNFFGIYKYVINGFQKFTLIAASEFVSLFAVSVLACIFGYFGGIFWALIGWGIGVLIGDLISILAAHNILKKIKSTPFSVKPIFLKYSVPMYLMIIPNFVTIAIIPILSLFYSPLLVGYYSFVFVFYNGIALIPNALYQVLLPKISQLHGNKKTNEGKEILKRVLGVYGAFAILGVIISVWFAGDIIQLLAPKYLPGTIIFQYLIPGGIVIGFLRILQTYYSAINKITPVAWTVILQNVLLAILSFYSVGLVV